MGLRLNSLCLRSVRLYNSTLFLAVAEGLALPMLVSHVAETLMNDTKVPERGQGKTRCQVPACTEQLKCHISLTLAN